MVSDGFYKVLQRLYTSWLQVLALYPRDIGILVLGIRVCEWVVLLHKGPFLSPLWWLRSEGLGFRVCGFRFCVSRFN